MKKKVLFAATVAKKHICQFHIPYLKWFKEQGYEVHVCAKNDFEKDEVCDIAYCDRFYPVNFSRSPFSPENFTAYLELKTILRENEYDLIHCHTPVAAAVARFAAYSVQKQGKTVVLYTTHGFHFFKGSPLFSKIFYIPERMLIGCTDGIIAINQEDYEAARKFCQKADCEAYYVHGMGVDTEKIANTHVNTTGLKQKFGIPENAFVLLSVSEINQNKNLKTTLTAFSRLENKNIYYLICGSGELLEYCRGLSEKLGISERVIFAGYRYDIFEVVHIADVFLFPSLREGLGVAALEAMSAGVPIIASDIRGVHEYAVHMENSILVAPGDVTGFVNAVRLLVENTELREKLGRNALQSVAPFDLKKSISSMEAIYCKYLGIKSGETEEATVKI